MEQDTFTLIEVPLNLNAFEKNSPDLEVLRTVAAARATAQELLAEHREMDALERIVSGMRALREFSDYDNTEFRALLMALLSDLAEIHFLLKDYKQSEKELEMLFKVLDPLIRQDSERFARYHILAMELSTRILRSRKKTMELLVKQQLAAEALYDKVNAGVLAATDRLVDSLRNVGQLLASTGDYRGAMKFYAEAIKISKKKSGRVTRKEIKMTIEMAEIMMRLRQMRPRARRLLSAILPHAIALETIELEEDILALVEMMDIEDENEPRWKMFVHKLTKAAKAQLRKEPKEEAAPEDKETAEEEEKEAKEEKEAGEENQK